MRKYFAIFTLLITAKAVYGQTKFVNEFLNIGVGARAHGMFGSVVANSNDASAAYWNAANLTEIQAPLSISAMHANWFGDIANYDYFTIARRLNSGRSYGAFSLIRMGVDNIPNTLSLVNPDGTVDFNRVKTFSAADYGFLFSFGTRIGSSDKLNVGGTLKIIRRVVGEFSKSFGFGTDFSATYKLNNKIKLAATARDITTTFNSWSFKFTEEEKKVLLSTGNDVPVSSNEVALPKLIVGGAYYKDFSEKISFIGELDAVLSTNGTEAGILSGKSFSVDPSVGFELSYIKRVYVRAGIGNLQRILNEVNADRRTFDFQPNVGLGLSLGRLKIDYALANVGNLSGALASHIFSLNLDFLPKEQN
jgi:hypothetical protein